MNLASSLSIQSARCLNPWILKGCAKSLYGKPALMQLVVKNVNLPSFGASSFLGAVVNVPEWFEEVNHLYLVSGVRWCRVTVFV